MGTVTCEIEIEAFLSVLAKEAAQFEKLKYSFKNDNSSPNDKARPISVPLQAFP